MEAAPIAIFYVNLKTFTRAKGQSAVAAAAYRAGTPTGFRDERTGILHTYGRKRGIVSVDIHLPVGAPVWAHAPEKLWNHAEAAETRINSRVAFEWIVALPSELNVSQRAALVADLSRFLVDRYAVATMAAVHAPDTHGDQRNHHVHIMTSTRTIGPTGFGAKVRALVDRQTGPREIEAVRAFVAAMTNQHLERAGSAERVDHQRLLVQARKAEARGDFVKAATLIREATIHEGQAATAASRRGERSERSAWNAAVKGSNAQMLAAFVAAAELKGCLVDMPAGSGAEQAKAYRAREATNETNEARANVRQPRPMLPRSRTVRQKISVSAGRGTRAEGRDAELLNTQAAQASDARRVERDMSQRYIDMLQAIVEEHGQRAADAVAYARIHVWPIVDARALAQHRLRDPRCGPLLRRGLDAGAQLRRAQSLGARRRDRHGTAMVATAQERRNLDQVDNNQPTAWKPRSRRAWAELRRKQRARLGNAQRRERRAFALVTEHAMSRYADKALSAREVLTQIEGKRRTRYPVPGDAMRMGATAHIFVAPRQSIKAPIPVPPLPSPWMPPTGGEPRRPRPGA